MLIAIAHIAGSILATIAIWVVVFLLDAWHRQRNSKLPLQELSTRSGIAFDELCDEKHIAQTVEFLSDRFSNERFGNRLSDLCGCLLVAWGWLGSLLQIGILVGVVWSTATESLNDAMYAWSIPATAIFFCVAAALCSFLCRLLTGRFPGQAKASRKGLAEIMSARQSPSRYGLTESE